MGLLIGGFFFSYFWDGFGDWDVEGLNHLWVVESVWAVERVWV